MDIVFMGRIERMIYRIAPNGKIYTSKEYVSAKEIHRMENDGDRFRIGERLLLPKVGGIVVRDAVRCVETGNIIYETDYVVEVISDEETEKTREKH